MFGGLRNHFRRVGHRHRAAGRWAKAADAYARHVRFHAGDLPDWIRLTEMAMAADRPALAARAYRHLSKQSPNDPDIVFQLAQSLKRMGQEDQALAMFRRALLLSERVVPKPERQWPEPDPVAPGTILYSVQDMVSYLTRHPTVTGIQRVQAGIARYLLETVPEQVGFVLTDAEPGVRPGDFWQVDSDILLAIIDAAEAVDGDHTRLKSLIADCRRTARPIRPGAGHTLIVLGAFWALGNAPVRYFAAKRRGARIGVYVYDLIPITHPQFCEMELSLHFSVGFGQICALADFFLTISEDTARRVRSLLSEHDLAPVPVQAVPLAHGRALDPTLTLTITPAGGIDRPFVAYVSTIEARKNHIYVVRVWQALMDAGVAVPDLWFVGRPGWKIEPLTALLAETGNLGGRVRLMHDLTDAELADVYRQAMFTVFTSFVEGWGLPIGESLAHGTPCVASDGSSMPEVGGDLVDYVDPTDIDNGVGVIGRLLTDPPALVERRARIAAHFVPRTWDEVGADFAQAVRSLSVVAPHPLRPPLLEAGRIFRLGERLDVDFTFDALMRSPRGLLLADRVLALCDDAAWMDPADIDIRFRSDLQPATPITLTLELYRSDRLAKVDLSVSSGDDRRHVPFQSLPVVETAPLSLSLNGSVAADGTVAITLASDAPAADDATARIGLVSIVHQARGEA